MSSTHLINTHISGCIMTIVSITLQILLWIYAFNNVGTSTKVIFILFFPIYFTLSAFFVFYCVNLLYNIVVPPKWIEQNSKYLSYTSPFPIAPYDNNEKKQYDMELGQMPPLRPHSEIHPLTKVLITSPTKLPPELRNTKPITLITIQIPVYTEDFDETLKATYENVKHFVQYFNDKYGYCKANVLINEDGLLKVSPEEKQKRVNYYDKFDELFYIARPVNGRVGRFKKASNMNFGMEYIMKINSKPESERDMTWLFYQEIVGFEYKRENSCTFEIGKYILLLDSDSKFNPYAIESLIYEMELSDNIGYMQVKTKSNKIIKHMWENSISHFTNSIYGLNFLYACSNGFPAPLVGHNVILRWSAMLEVEKFLYGRRQTYDMLKIWDDNRVSEDFVMSIYMQHIGYHGKYVFYDCGFMEGVSLDILDEITKLKKYIYGVNEIMFYPINMWTSEGILSHLYCNFLFSPNITSSTKYALLSYMGSYYSMAFSPIVTSWYYFSTFFGLTTSFAFLTKAIDIVYTCAFIFFGLSLVSNILVKIKHGFVKTSICTLVLKEIGYGLYLTLFYSCVSWHLLIMIILYFFSIDAKWSTTRKEASKLTIFDIINSYKIMYMFGSMMLVIVIYGLFPSNYYHNTDIHSVVPFLMMVLAHMLIPIFSLIG
jgi:hypothetical protein